MTYQLRVFAIATSILLLIVIIDLVRRRKLLEEYSWLWLGAGLVMCVLPLSYDLMLVLGELFGGILPSALLFLFSTLALFAISLHYSVKLSRLTTQVKSLAQEIAILRAERQRDP